MADALQTILERSSIRAYTDEALTKEEIEFLVKTGLLAPTAANRQEVFICAVKTSDPAVQLMQKTLNPNADGTFYYNAPELFVLFGKDGFSWGGLDSGIAVENMHLAAKAMGLGSVIIGCIDKVMWGEKKEEISKMLQIPEGFTFTVALAVGHPATEKAPHEYDFAKNAVILD